MSSRGSPRSPPAVPRLPFSSSSSAFSKPVRKPSANRDNTAGQTRYQIPIFNSTSTSVSNSTATTPSPASSTGSNSSSYPSPITYASTPPSRPLSQDGIDIRIQMEQGFLPYAALPVHTAEIVRTNVITGLPESEAEIRIKDLVSCINVRANDRGRDSRPFIDSCGRNSMPQPSLSVWAVVKEELMEPMILLLLAVAFLYSLWGKIEEAVTAAGIVLLTISLELYTEWRAKAALLKLSTSAFQPPVTVVRGGVFLKKDKEELVVGDICQISAGERIVADGRLLSCSSLLLDESMLTGESHPVSKEATITLPAGTPLTQRLNMVYSGTFVLHGSARYIVTATAMRTEMGLLSQLATGAKAAHKRESRTALQVFLKELAVTLTFVAAVACMITMTLGFMRGFQYQIVVLMGLSLAFACIPEELPVLIKAVLAVSALQLSRKNVLVKSLRTAEALGSTSLLLTDKTGTLTRNELHLLRLSMAGKMLHVPRAQPEDEPTFTQEKDYPNSPITSSKASKSRPFKASTDDMLAFEPMLAQGWLLSSPGLIHTLLHSEASIYGAREAKKTKSNSVNGGSGNTYPTQTSVIAARAEEALLRASQSFPLIRDPLDSALLRFFFTRRSHPLDLNSAFLRRMLADALIASESTSLVHVIPYDPIRRRSSTLRRMNQPPSASSSEHQSSLFPTEQISLEDNSSPEETQSQANAAAAAVPLRLLTRGGGECVLSICTYAVHSSLGIIKLTPAVRDDLEREMRIMAETGVRVMGFAVRSIDEKQVEKAFSIAAKSGTTPREPTAPIAEAEAIRTDQPTMTPSSPNSTASSSNASLPSSPLVVLERGMTFLGFVGLGDVLRPGVGRTIHQLQRAGVEVKIVTGDFQHTGAAVAKAVGVLPANGVPSSSTAAAEKNRRANLKKKAEQDATRMKSAMHKPHATGNPASTPTRHNSSGLYVDSTGVLASPDEIDGVLVGPLRPKLASSARRSQATTPTANDDSPRTPTRIVTPIPERPSPIVGVFNPPQAMGLSRSRNTSANDLQRLLLPQALHVDLSAKVYTRMTPNDKLAIVLAHQKKGARVLVSGDGANDAAALAAADAGLAMGSSKAGTDLAREMAGLILVNDDFHGVYIAIREGRRALENLSKALRFYLACKCALVFLFLLPLAVGFDLPLAPLHIIILEAFLDLGATAAFTYEIAESNLMKRPPSDWAREKYMKGKRVMLEICSAAMLLLSTLLVTLFLAYNIQSVRHAAPLHANEMFPLQLNALPIAGMSEQPYGNINSVSHANSNSTASYHRTWSKYWNLLEVYSAAAASPSSSIAPSSGTPAGTTPLSSPQSTSSHTESHSSSSFFPSILPTYTHDPHLFLTHSIMLVCWLITTVLLANFMRSSSRSYLFACCDRRSLQVVRERRRRKRREEVRAARKPGDAVSPMPIDSTSSLSAAVSAQSSYASLSSVESGLPKPRSEERVDRVGLDNSPNWLGSSSGDSSDTDTTDEEGEEGVEGLFKQRRSVYLQQQSQFSNTEPASGAALLFEEEYGGLFEEVFPLLANPLMLFWAIVSVIFAYAAITHPWMRQHLHLSDMNVPVLIPLLFGSHHTVPAYAVAIIPTLVIFFVAELCKFVYSLFRSTNQMHMKSVPVEGQYETFRSLGVRGAHPKKMRNNEPYTVQT